MMKTKVLENKNAIVTGGARGIGKSIVKKFLSEGAKVVFCDVNVNNGKLAERELSGLGNVKFIPCDVTRPQEVRNLVDSSKLFFKNEEIDILVNNAGINLQAQFEDITIEMWEKTIATDLTGVFLVCKEVVKEMKKAKKGNIINMASTNGLFAEENLSHYNAAKGGVIMLTKTMALELAQYGIRVNSVCPGFILTELLNDSGYTEQDKLDYFKRIPMNRGGLPEEVAAGFLFLASDESSYITGSEIVIDGGQTCHE